MAEGECWYHNFNRRRGVGGRLALTPPRGVERRTLPVSARFTVDSDASPASRHGGARRNFAVASRVRAQDVPRVRHLFIVSRDHPWLYAHLVERFRDDSKVDVILDRRIGERRATISSIATQQDRRKNDRRRAVPPEDDLRVRSHYIVEL